MAGYECGSVVRIELLVVMMSDPNPELLAHYLRSASRMFALEKGTLKVGVFPGKPPGVSSWANLHAQEELQEAYREKRLPSTYLLEGEHPEDALRRIMRQQLGIPEYSSSGPRVYSVQRSEQLVSRP